ncbi:MAG: 50S ribosomal protein L3 N(5)-glutamine methyltransferase [Gammaproteobacteria bacterium]|nr:50S ribosomal protein L3 N(5)-glutamine methyltransferase [Gammaproteobacteria bacterium]
MTPDQLEARLAAAADHEAWIEAVADHFRAGGVFFGHGTDNADDEAYWLIRHVEDWRDDLWEAPPDRRLIARIVDVAGRRVRERRPLAYLLGEAWFAGLRFHVNENVLIPRSPMAEIIERCFTPWAELGEGARVLDVGTGSGCLAIAAAWHCPGILVDATDVSKAALAVAKRNIERHGLGGRVRLHEADLFPATTDRFSVIMSNPPYVPERDVDALPPEYAHEPRLALAGGPDGLAPTEQLMRAARERLTPDGVLIVEVGAEAETLMRRHPRLPAVWLDFERGGEGVFVLTARQLEGYFGGGTR